MPSNRIKCASLQDFAGWAKDAWCMIPPTMVSKALKCGILNVMDGSKDYLLWAVESEESSDSDKGIACPWCRPTALPRTVVVLTVLPAITGTFHFLPPLQ